MCKQDSHCTQRSSFPSCKVYWTPYSEEERTDGVESGHEQRKKNNYAGSENHSSH